MLCYLGYKWVCDVYGNPKTLINILINILINVLRNILRNILDFKTYSHLTLTEISCHGCFILFKS